MPRPSSVTSPTSHVSILVRRCRCRSAARGKVQCLRALANIVIWVSPRVYQYIISRIRILIALPASRTELLLSMARGCASYNAQGAVQCTERLILGIMRFVRLAVSSKHTYPPGMQCNANKVIISAANQLLTITELTDLVSYRSACRSRSFLQPPAK